MAVTTVGVRYDLLARDKASGAFAKVGKSAHGAEGHLAKLGKTFKKTVIGTGLGLGGLIAVGKKSVDLYSEFDATIRQVGIQTKSSTKPLEKLAIQLGQKTAYSAKDAADAMLELAKSGMSSAQIQAGGLADTLKLAQAGGVELGDAAAFMTNSMHAFGLKASDGNKIVTALAGAANASTASVQSLGYGLAQASSNARNAGLSLNDTVAVLAAFDNAGIKGQDAGTSLKTMLQRLVPQTDKAKAAMKDLGLKFTDAHGKFLKITDIAQQLHDKLGPLTAAQRTQALQTIFGSDATRAATILMREGKKGLEKYEKATRDSGAANKLAKSRMKGLSGAIENMKGSAETTAIRIGKTIAPAVAGIARIISNRVLPKLGDFVDFLGHKVAPIVKQVAKPIGKVLGGAFSAISSNVGDFLKGAMHGLQFKGRAITPDQIVSVQQGASPTAAGKAGAALRSFIQKIMDISIKSINVNKIGSRLGSAVVTAVGWIGRHIMQVEHALISAMSKVDWVGIGKAVGSRAFGFAIGFINTFFDPLMSGAFWRKNWKTMLEVAASLIPAGKFAGVLGKTLFKESKFLGPITRGMGRLADLMLKPVKALGRLIADGIWLGFKREFPKTATFLEKEGLLPILRLRILLSSAGHKAGSAITNGISRGAAGLTGLMLRIVKRILSPFAHAGGWLVGKGRDIISGLSKGLIGRAQAVWKWIGSIDGRITQFFRNAGGWLYSKGRDVIGGLSKGLVDRAQPVWKWIGAISSKVTAPFRNAAGWLYGHGRDIIGGLFKGLGDRLAAFGGWYKWIKAHTFDPIVHAVKSLFGIASPSKVMHGLGSNVMEGFVKGMLLHNPLSVAKKLVKDIPGLISAAIGNLGTTTIGGHAHAGVPENNRLLGMQMAKSAYGWTGAEWVALDKLITRESGWSNTAQNPSSGAYGIFQFLNSTWRSFGAKTSNVAKQIAYGLQYVKQRYGDPLQAWTHEMMAGWYGNGLVNGIFRKPTLIGVGERGAERVNVTPLSGGRGGGPARITGTVALTADSVGNVFMRFVDAYIHDAASNDARYARAGMRP